jgi:hypothetical protein
MTSGEKELDKYLAWFDFFRVHEFNDHMFSADKWNPKP